MKKKINLLILVGTALSIVILAVPLDILEYLSLEVVGEPPINGRTWMEGVYELGGEISMRLLAILGVAIVVLSSSFVLNWENKPLNKREVNNLELLTFFLAVITFFTVNILIGYDWWDPDAFLGMGALFIPSILSLILLGLLPTLFSKTFKIPRDALAVNTENLKEISITMILIAFGYGLISVVWHCCSFF